MKQVTVNTESVQKKGTEVPSFYKHLYTMTLLLDNGDIT